MWSMFSTKNVNDWKYRGTFFRWLFFDHTQSHFSITLLWSKNQKFPLVIWMHYAWINFQEILENYKVSGTKVREAINKIIERVNTTNSCECPLPRLESCAKCLRLRAVNELCNKGFTATLCTSKWNQTEKKLGGNNFVHSIPHFLRLTDVALIPNKTNSNPNYTYKS